jgi:hypothetical protein
VVTKDTAVSLSFLWEEFFIHDLGWDRGAFAASLDQFSSLSGRGSQLERQISSLSNPSVASEGEIESHEQTARFGGKA